MERIRFNGRKFKFWFYQVSHSEAIIRSPKTDLNKVYDRNIDIFLYDICYIEMPCILHDLQIAIANEKDKEYLSEKLGKDIPINKIIVLFSEGKKYYIVSSGIKILENNLEYGLLPIHSFFSNENKNE